jgi:hypothetical protein
MIVVARLIGSPTPLDRDDRKTEMIRKRKEPDAGGGGVGLLILTGNWEEEMSPADEGALGGGVLCLREHR